MQGVKFLQNKNCWVYGTEHGTFCFHLKKSTTESVRFLSVTYSKCAPSILTYWFRRIESGNFDTESKERSGHPAEFENEELKDLYQAL